MPSFRYEEVDAGKPISGATLYPNVAAYAAMMGGRLITGEELDFAHLVIGDDFEMVRGGVRFRVVLPDDPLRLLNCLPFGFGKEMVPFSDAVYLDTLLKGYHGLFNRAAGTVIVAEDKKSAVEWARDHGIEGGASIYFSENLEGAFDPPFWVSNS